MATKLHTSTLLVLSVLSCCTGIDTAPSGPRGKFDDEVALLQGQLELKKGQAKPVEQAATALEDSDYTGLSSCSAAEFCSGGDSPSSFKITFPPSDRLDAGAPEKAAQAPESVPEVGSAPEANASEVVGESSLSTLGTVLEVLACLLVADMLRRCSWKNTEKRSTKASAASPSGSPLLAAALAGDEAGFECELASTHSQLSQVDNWGCTALHYAAKGGSVCIVRRLLDLGAQVDAIDAWDETPLHLAARSGHEQVCETLLLAGAFIDAANAEDHTPLVVAGHASHEAVCSLLIGRGAGVAGLLDEQVPCLVAGLLMQQVIASAAPGLSLSR